MKKLITILLAVMMVVTMLPVTAEASNPYQDYDKNYASNKKLVDNERTDEYALDFFSYSSTEDWAAKYPEQYKVMKEVTKGIKDDYEKVKALAEWVNKNMTYDTKNDADGSLAAAGIPEWMRGACGEYADTFTVLARLAGFPAKSIFGVIKNLGGQYHAWNHVFVDGRWIFVDTTYGYFDRSVESYSAGYFIGSLPDTDWDGTLTLTGSNNRQRISTIGPLPLHTTVDKIPELKGITLYLDLECTKPVDPKTWKFDSLNRQLYTKTYRVSFEIQLDNQYKSLVPHYVREDEYGDLYAYITVPEGGKLPQVKLPEKSGYTFIGWRDLYDDKAPIWNEDVDRVTEDMSFVAVFQKGTVNTNRPVTSNTNNTNNANPTSSKVLVNGNAVQFDAYNINGNNYFKLRDFAQAVNNTEKNFEVTWDGKNNAINLISNKPYTSVGGELVKGDGKAKVANPTTSKIYKDGKEISLTAYNIGGNNYFKLRDLAKAFDIGVTWDGTTNTVGIDTSIGYVEE